MDTNSTGRLAPLDGIILAGQIEFLTEETSASFITLWENGIPLPTDTTTATTTTTTEEVPPQMDDTTTTTTTTTNVTTTDDDDAISKSVKTNLMNSVHPSSHR